MKTTFDLGRKAESAAADHLKKLGFKIRSQNWRTRTCEIDIVAQKDKTIYFVEVKYRQSDGQGSGLEYVTQAKQRQMQFAAETWVAENDWAGDYQLAAIEVSGAEFAVTEFINQL